MPYRTLDPAKIISTLERLDRRIEERFPGRGLAEVCKELLGTARHTADRAREMTAPFYGLRVLSGLLVVAGVSVLAFGIYQYMTAPALETEEAFHVFQGVEALINIMILVGAGLWFLLTLESRTKQARVLSDLHELRALAHIIDMHQLTKDPVIVMGMGPKTSSSPDRNMNAFELSRYLDYCSEMLSLTAKIAALYLATSRDHVVIQAVNEIQDLTTSLSAKIFQKISLIHTEDDR